MNSGSALYRNVIAQSTLPCDKDAIASGGSICVSVTLTSDDQLIWTRTLAMKVEQAEGGATSLMCEE